MENWNGSDKAYAGFLKELGAKDERWFKFAGMALTAGIELDISAGKIVEAIMETVHAMDIGTEVPLTYEEVIVEMKLWKEEDL